MATVELTKDNFDEVVSANQIVLIDFWASWCGPCRMFAPIYERVAEQHPDITFGKVDTEAQPELAARFHVSAIPTVAVIRNRVLEYAQPGALPEPALQQLINKTRALPDDVDEPAEGENRAA